MTVTSRGLYAYLTMLTGNRAGTNFPLDSKRLKFFQQNMEGLNPDIGINMDEKNHFVMTVEK